MKTRFRPDHALIGATMLWGGSFLVTHVGLAGSGPMTFVALRFGIAALVLLALRPRALANASPLEWRAGLLVGFAMFVGYAALAVALQTVPSGKVAFLAALYVPLVPILQFLILRRPPQPAVWLGTLLAMAGVYLLSGASGLHGMGVGEWLAIASAVAIAAEILLIGRFAAQVDTFRFAIVLLISTSGMAAGAAILRGEPAPNWDARFVLAVVGLGVATAVMQLAMNWAQRTVAPARATLIYASEPVWAGLIGWIAGEAMGLSPLLGAGLIVSAVIVSALPPGALRLKPRPQSSPLLCAEGQ